MSVVEMTSYRINPDALLQIREGNWVLSNPRTKTHVLLDSLAVSQIAEKTGSCQQTEWVSSLAKASGSDWSQDFFGAVGLHSDHTGILQNQDSVSGLELFKLLSQRWLLVQDDLEQYQKFLSGLSSVLDRDHLGSFHQRVGQYLTIEKRIGAERWRWWHNQKFSDDGKKVKSGPYHDIQENYFDSYFTAEKLKGLKVLDFGCGNGYYSAKLAQLGAEVTGIDTSKELIDLAQQNHSKIADFIFIDPASHPEQLRDISSDKFDLIFMQDVLLILMKPENGKVFENLNPLLLVLHSLLKNKGRLYTMEPNAVFWLAGRYGDKNNPYAIVTEYQKQIFNVVPIFTDVVNLMSQSGFALVEYQHPKSAEKNVYANNFCIWDFMCFMAI